MDKNKKEFMFDMEVFSSNILEARLGTYFFWGADKIEAIERLNYRLIWHGARLDEYLKNASAALIMVNCCNDLFKPLGMEFTDEKKITDN